MLIHANSNTANANIQIGSSRGIFDHSNKFEQCGLVYAHKRARAQENNLQRTNSISEFPIDVTQEEDEDVHPENYKHPEQTGLQNTDAMFCNRGDSACQATFSHLLSTKYSN